MSELNIILPREEAQRLYDELMCTSPLMSGTSLYSLLLKIQSYLYTDGPSSDSSPEGSMTLRDLMSLYSKALEIYNSGLSWEAKYDLIFSKEISGRISLKYYDPDTSYEEDVTAFMKAFAEYVGKPLPI